MMSMHTPSHDILAQSMAAIDRYLHGEMPEAEAAVFERRLETEPWLRAQLESQRVLDAVLRSNFTPPPPPAAPPREPGPSAPPPFPLIGGLLSLPRGVIILAGAVAAAGALTLGVAIWPGPSAPPQPLAGNAALEREMARAETPDAEARDAEQLGILVSQKLGRPIRLTGGAGIRYLGVRPAEGGSPLRVAIVAEVAGGKALVLADLAAHGAPDSNPSTSRVSDSLYAHERTQGGIRFVELSASPSPTLLGRVEVLSERRVSP